MTSQSQASFNPYQREFDDASPEEVRDRAAHLLWENVSLLEKIDGLNKKLQTLEAERSVHHHLVQRVREELKTVDPGRLEAVDSQFLDLAAKELGRDRAEAILSPVKLPIPKATGKAFRLTFDEDKVVEHGVVFTVELRVEAETLELAKEYGEDWLQWNLTNLGCYDQAIEPYSMLAPVEVADRFREKDLGYYFHRARITPAYDQEFALRFECAGVSPGDSRGEYAESDWIEPMEDRIAFYRAQQR